MLHKGLERHRHTCTNAYSISPSCFCSLSPTSHLAVVPLSSSLGSLSFLFKKHKYIYPFRKVHLSAVNLYARHFIGASENTTHFLCHHALVSRQSILHNTHTHTHIPFLLLNSPGGHSFLSHFCKHLKQIHTQLVQNLFLSSSFI